MRKKVISFMVIIATSIILAGLLAVSEFDAYSVSPVSPITVESEQSEDTETIDDTEGDIIGDFIDEDTIYFKTKNNQE